tara:strand:- start:6664 stop:9474 length:2811 start_codon:yes stop_codon:yes gene_type:complete
MADTIEISSASIEGIAKALTDALGGKPGKRRAGERAGATGIDLEGLPDDPEKKLEKLNKLLEKTNEEYEKQKKNLERNLELTIQHGTKAEINLTQTRKQIEENDALLEKMEAEVAIAKEKHKLGKISQEQLDELKSTLEDTTREFEAQNEQLELIDEVQEDIRKKMDAGNVQLDKMSAHIYALQKDTKGWMMTFALPAAMKGLDKMDSLISGPFNTIKNTMIGLVVSTQAAEKGFMRATGASEEMARSIRVTHEELRGYGVTAESAAATKTALYNTFTDFTMSSNSMQKSLEHTGAVLGQLGVAEQDFAQGIQNSVKMFGQSGEEAEATSRELVAHAKDLGVSVGELATKYASMGPQLAKFGDQGTKAFKDLAHISKITGMEMEKVLGVANKFDTFEDAAGMAGKLNAALGGNFVNAMDMMMETDPAARFGMVRDSILDAGLSFDDMSYYQKQFYTESLGLSDVGDLAQMLSGDMEGLSGDMGKNSEELIAMKDAAKANQTMMEKWQAMLAEASPMLMGIIDALTGFIGKLQENIGVVKAVILGILGLKAAIIVLKGAMFVAQLATIALNLAKALGLGLTTAQTAATGLGTVASGADAAAKGSQAVATEGLAAAQLSQATSTKAVGRAGSLTWPVVLAMGAAMLFLGVGIGIAALGVAILIRSFRDMGVEAIAAAIALGILMVPFVAFMILMGVLVYSGVGEIAALILLAMGVSVLMLGGGLFLAAAGLSLLVLAFTELFGVLSMAEFFAFVVILVGLYLAFSMLGALAPLAAAGMLLFAVGMLAIGVALMTLIPTMLIFTMFTDSIAALVEQKSELAEIATAFMAIGKAIEEIPAVKTAILTTLMTATAPVAIAAATAGTITGTVMGAVGATPGARGAAGAPGATQPHHHAPMLKDVKVDITLNAPDLEAFLSGKTKSTLGKASFAAIAGKAVPG